MPVHYSGKRTTGPGLRLDRDLTEVCIMSCTYFLNRFILRRRYDVSRAMIKHRGELLAVPARGTMYRISTEPSLTVTRSIRSSVKIASIQSRLWNIPYSPRRQNCLMEQNSLASSCCQSACVSNCLPALRAAACAVPARSGAAGRRSASPHRRDECPSGIDPVRILLAKSGRFWQEGRPSLSGA